jgi:hypothetical protein
MKPVPLSILLACALLVFSCEDRVTQHYYKSFFIHETSFTIEGEVFVNDSLTEKAEFSRIFVRTNAAEGWEIEGVKKEGNKFELLVDVVANGITLSSETIVPGAEEDYGCILSFYVDVRRARGAIEPEFGDYYYYVYISEAIDLSRTETYESSDMFGDTIYEYYYDLNYSQPGWYKVYHSENKPIGNKASYSSGANTKIRSPK